MPTEPTRAPNRVPDHAPGRVPGRAHGASTYRIGAVTLPGKVFLAPMAGVTDLPYRRMVKRFGVALVVSEMIASKAMIMAARRTRRMASMCDDEFPMAVQLAGNEPDVVAEAARMNEQRGAAIIDLNMGCPAKKVVHGYAGSALMKDEVLAGKILEAAVNAVSVPVTLKMRTGWDDQTRNAPKLARIAEESGIRSLVVHGRTRCQFYKGRSDWGFIGEVKQAVSIPVTGNGDVTTVDDAAALLQLSGADGVMIGRGSYGRPWFPAQVQHFLDSGERLPEPGLEVQLATLLEHYEAMLSHYGEHTGMRAARKHIGWYSKGLPGSAEFRARVMREPDSAKVKVQIGDFYAPLMDKLEREPCAA